MCVAPGFMYGTQEGCSINFTGEQVLRCVFYPCQKKGYGVAEAFMAYGKINSHLPNMKGISLDLPFFRFRYVKVQDESQKQVQSETAAQVDQSRGIDSSAPRAITVSYIKPAEVTTLGIDPLVSSASVIHELVYGRISGSSGETKPQTTYPAAKEYIPPSLDIVV